MNSTHLWGRKKMYKTLEKLINKHFYADRETAIAKVDTVFAMSKITESQYADLTMLIDEIYGVEEQ